MDIARTIADNAPLSVAASKLTIERVMRDESHRDMDAVERPSPPCFDSADYREGQHRVLGEAPAAISGPVGGFRRHSRQVVGAKERKPGAKPGFQFDRRDQAPFLRTRRAMPSPVRPAPSSSSEAGSGTGVDTSTCDVERRLIE